MPERIYTGSHPRGSINPAGERVRFERGVPVEVSAKAAAALDRLSDWTAPKKKPTPDKPKPEPKSEGSKPDHKEP